jgi:hypothetical protein
MSLGQLRKQKKQPERRKKCLTSKVELPTSAKNLARHYERCYNTFRLFTAYSFKALFLDSPQNRLSPRKI